MASMYAVYAAYAGHDLVYVGITKAARVHRRWAEHRRARTGPYRVTGDPHWVVISTHPTETTAAAIERQLIHRMRPSCNLNRFG